MAAEAFERLRPVALFDGMSDDDLARICADVRDVSLEAGQTLFHEGDRGDVAYVITAGQVDIVKATERREVLLAVRRAGDVIGEMALLHEEPRMAGARARDRTQLVAIPKAALDEVLDSSPSAARAMFNTFLTRLKATNDQLKQSERMAQLGTLTAGVAHELNNPAAAVARAAQRLEDELDALAALAAAPTRSPARRAALAALAAIEPGGRTPADALARSDAEADVEDWLEGHGVHEPWQLSAALVDVGIGPDQLATLGDGLAPDELDDAIRLLVTTASARQITREIHDGVSRISTIVRALKSYAYLDQSPVQDVDVHQGLEDTLVLLANKTRHVQVVREYAEDVPTITALGTELNQVWTNLIDNACDALEALEDRIPKLTLRTGTDHGSVTVEVEDNGPGIAEGHAEQVFDAFFTTKPPGKGTGLGLQISYRIVVLEHRGDLTFTSEPGRTTFRVTLPTHPPATTPTEDTMQTEPCDHLDTISDDPRPEGGCQQCLDAGDTWVHLRYCDQCLAVGCCDDSKNRHARAHAAASDHPVVRSREPGEDWAWCFEHRVGVELTAPA